MFKFNDEKGNLKCSFCGKPQEQVRKLVAGPGVYICDECIELCSEIVVEELGIEEEIEFNEIPFELVMDACLDTLGVIDISHLTLNFIVKLGLYFTQQEMQQPVNKLFADNKHGLYEKDPETGKAKNRLDVIKRELKLNPAINLRICNTGLNYNEFRSMYYLKRDKYSNLTTDQLKLLSNKVLYRFQDQCEMQAKQWEEKIREINEVAESKGWDVTRG